MMRTNYIITSLLVFFFQAVIIYTVKAQESDPFRYEVEALSTKYGQQEDLKGGIVFTGSSSIRMWATLEKDFPKAKIINTGFGGSQTHHLLKYLDKLVLPFEPKKVFIYEGDNDINAMKPIPQILEEFLEIMEKVTLVLPEAQFYFISAKPSPSRWEKKEQYELFNDQLKKFTLDHHNTHYIDIWSPMLDKDGKPKTTLFIGDNLHMNAKGYAIWKKAVKPYMK